MSIVLMYYYYFHLSADSCWYILIYVVVSQFQPDIKSILLLCCLMTVLLYACIGGHFEISIMACTPTGCHNLQLVVIFTNYWSYAVLLVVMVIVSVVYFLSYMIIGGHKSTFLTHYIYRIIYRIYIMGVIGKHTFEALVLQSNLP